MKKLKKNEIKKVEHTGTIIVTWQGVALMNDGGKMTDELRVGASRSADSEAPAVRRVHNLTNLEIFNGEPWKQLLLVVYVHLLHLSGIPS